MKLFKHVLNILFLSISIFLSAYFMIHLTENKIIRIGLVVFVVCLESAMQYVLALGKQKMRLRKWFYAGIMFLCYACYIFIYNIPSAVGFFVAEIAIQDRATARIERQDAVNQIRLAQVQKTIDNLNKQLEYEAETGYGARSKAIMDQLDKLSTEQDRLLGEIQVAPVVEVAKNNPFRGLADAIRVPANWLAVVVFGVSILMVCVVLIITSWDLPDETVTAKRGNAVTKAVTAVKPVTGDGVAFCKCGCGKAVVGKEYYDTACRVRAHRARRRGIDVDRIKREGVKIL